MQRIAIYDMDRTITRRPTYTPFLIHACRTLHPWRLFLAPFAIATMLLYLVHLIDRGTLKEWNQALLLGRAIPEKKLRPVVESFVESTVTSNIPDAALAQIKEDRLAGHTLVLATASYRLYAEAIGHALGFDDVIATDNAHGPDDSILAQIAGENCYGPAKLAMVKDWLDRHGLPRDGVWIRFYSDHVSDASVMSWSDEAFAVNPHAKLRRLAALKNWPVLRWR